MHEPGMLPSVAAKRWFLPLCLLLLPACADDGDGDGDGDELAVDQVCETALEECTVCEDEVVAYQACFEQDCPDKDELSAASNACIKACLTPITELDLYAVGDGMEWGQILEDRAFEMIRSCYRFPEECMDRIQSCEDAEQAYLEAG